MNLILVSGRHPPEDSRLEADAKYAAALVGEGHDVRWIVPYTAPGAAPGESDGVRTIPVPTELPGFRSVQDQLKDIPTEAAVAGEIRRELPDVVHLLHYGGSTSVNVSWVSERMGAATVVTVDPPQTLCHRGDLVDGTGAACEEWGDPDRCADCCLTPRRAAAGAEGVSRVGGLVGRTLGAVRSPINPFPSRVAFLDRLELILGGLQIVSWVTVPTDADRDRVASIGMRRDKLAVLPEPTLQNLREWIRFYERMVEGEVAGV